MSIWYGGLVAGVSMAAIAPPVVEMDAVSPISNVSREQLEKLPASRSVAPFVKTCPARTIPTVTTQPPALIDGRTTAPRNISSIQPSDLRMIDVYRLHNEARAEVGSLPLVWDPTLAAQAQSYGPELAQFERPVHSSRVGRETSGENLLQSLPGTSPTAMMGVWTGERRYFVNGKFPDVSTTGNWADVGHYTQLVWPTTTNLGCAIHTGGRFDWLICRYSPPGNRDGKMVLAVAEKEPPKPVDRILFCSPARMAAHDVRIPWNSSGSTGQPYSGSYNQISDHLPVKAEYDGTPKPPPGKHPRRRRAELASAGERSRRRRRNADARNSGAAAKDGKREGGT